jgi:hypothetical protein
VGQFRARIASADFRGTVEARTRDGLVRIEGRRPPHWLVLMRQLGQYALLALGLLGVLTRDTTLQWALLAALVYSVVGHLAMQAFAREDAVDVIPGAQTEARVSWPAPGDRSLLEAAVETASDQGGPSVVFRAPFATDGARHVQYVLVAGGIQDASALVASLLGTDGPADREAVGRTSAST